jgi:NADPH2:quinone reductase
MDHGIDYSHDGWVDKVRELTGGNGVDLVVDSVGGRILQGSVACLAYRGRCITVGSAGRDEQPLDVRALGAGNQSITGVFLGAEITTPRAQQMVQGLVDDVAAGRLKVVVDRTFPLSEAAAAHAYIESRQAVGRVVLIP